MKYQRNLPIYSYWISGLECWTKIQSLIYNRMHLYQS